MFYGEFALQLENALLPNEATTLDEFVHELKEALDANQLGTRALDHLFSDQAEFHPTCHGLWMEFGVFEGLLKSSLSSQSKQFDRDSLAPSTPQSV